MDRFLLSFLSIAMALCSYCGNGEEASKNTPNQEKTGHNEVDNLEPEEAEHDQSNYVLGNGKNQPPRIKRIRLVNASEDNPRAGFRADVQAEDPDGDEVSLGYQWKKNHEEIIGAVNPVLEWQEDFKKGDYISVEIIPFDGKDEGIWKSEEGFTIPNSPPEIVSVPEERMEGGKFMYVLKADDPDGDQVGFTLKNAPKGMILEPATGVISWEFDQDHAGEYQVEVIASDPEGAKTVQILSLTVPLENL